MCLRRLSDHYVSEYDPMHRNPRWVCEYLTRQNIQGVTERANVPFKEEPGLHPRFRARLADYCNSGYDRGHLAPAADHKSDEVSMEDTFYLSNIAPQVGAGFNRDYWARFEQFVRDLLFDPKANAAASSSSGAASGAGKAANGGNTANNGGKHALSFDEVHVMTGVLYAPEWDPNGAPPSNGPNNNGKGGGEAAKGRWVYRTMSAIGQPFRWVTVPTHFYKVVVARKRHGAETAVAAFVMPNAPIPPEKPLTDFLVPVNLLEQVAGLAFFHNTVDVVEREAAEWELESNGLPSGPNNKAAVSVMHRNARDIFAKNFPGPMPLLLTPPAGTSGVVFDPSDEEFQEEVQWQAATSKKAARAKKQKQQEPHVYHLCRKRKCELPTEGFYAGNDAEANAAAKAKLSARGKQKSIPAAAAKGGKASQGTPQAAADPFEQITQMLALPPGKR
jgi:DNA/RNA endonuclease G (NUC1)